MTDAPKRRGPGRPRTLPEGTTPADRAALAKRQLRAAGGHELNIQLHAVAWQALQRLAPARSRGAYIERLILAADRADRLKGAGSGD